MKKLLFLMVVSLVLMTACAPKDQPDETPTPDNTPVENVTENKPVENAPDEKEPTVYQAFEYAVTARDWSEISGLSEKEKAYEFLSAICLSDEEALREYMQGDSVSELLNAKFEAKIGDEQEKLEHYVDYAYEIYLAKVQLNVVESDSAVFPVGTYEYTLKVTSTSQFFVEYFGPTERYEAFEGANVPDKETSPEFYDAYKFINEFLHYNSSKLSIEALSADLYFDSLFHIAIHDLMAKDEDYIFKTTLDEFKKYISLRYGYNDADTLQKFADKLSRVTYASADGNGVYTGSCAHGYSSAMYEVSQLSEKDGFFSLTYTFFSDSTHTVPCSEAVFSFKKNANTDVMTLIDIEYKTFNDFSIAIVSP